MKFHVSKEVKELVYSMLDSDSIIRRFPCVDLTDVIRYGDTSKIQQYNLDLNATNVRKQAELLIKVCKHYGVDKSKTKEYLEIQFVSELIAQYLEGKIKP